MRITLAICLAGFVAACGGSSPTTPTPTPNRATWALSGTVRAAGGGPIGLATIAVLDGPDAGRQASTDNAGAYSIAGLQQAGFSVRASANGFTPASDSVTLTANRTLDFQLQRLPVASLTFGGPITFTPRPDFGFDMAASGVNSGDGCASSVTGMTTLTGANGVVLTYAWSLPASTIIRPGEGFIYNFGPMSRSEAASFGTAQGIYSTRADFVSSGCQ